jgi:hypothetical protein
MSHFQTILGYTYTDNFRECFDTWPAHDIHLCLQHIHLCLFELKDENITFQHFAQVMQLCSDVCSTESNYCVSSAKCDFITEVKNAAFRIKNNYRQHDKDVPDGATMKFCVYPGLATEQSK